MLDEADRKKFRRLAATLKYTIRREGNMHEDCEADTREWEETEEGSQISERSTKRVTWAMRTWTCMWIRIRRKAPRGSRRVHDDDQRHSGETLVENTSNVCAEHGGS